MEWLRIIFSGKFHDLFFVNGMLAAVKNRTNGQIFKIDASR